ncbi:MAG: RnfABCDGE type electron transport complex subunit D, partial [Gammaproteobacteria bacterium]|nr:RnfABCDGE type electron transport complex subunit D [Gammaproteobacteria bacterium]
SIDAVTMATPLDTVRTRLGLGETLTELQSGALFGLAGGAGWEWVNLCFLAGGLFMLKLRVIQWRIPASMLAGLALTALAFHLYDPDTYASPLFHLFSGAAMLGAFFIATDPVSASTTPRGRLWFGFGIGVLTWVIRTWGGYPDGVAFAVLLMNLAAPTIDFYTRPRVFGQRKE